MSTQETARTRGVSYAHDQNLPWILTEYNAGRIPGFTFHYAPHEELPVPLLKAALTHAAQDTNSHGALRHRDFYTRALARVNSDLTDGIAHISIHESPVFIKNNGASFFVEVPRLVIFSQKYEEVFNIPNPQIVARKFRKQYANNQDKMIEQLKVQLKRKGVGFMLLIASYLGLENNTIFNIFEDEDIKAHLTKKHKQNMIMQRISKRDKDVLAKLRDLLCFQRDNGEKEILNNDKNYHNALDLLHQDWLIVHEPEEAMEIPRYGYRDWHAYTHAKVVLESLAKRVIEQLPPDRAQNSNMQQQVISHTKGFFLGEVVTAFIPNK